MICENLAAAFPAHRSSRRKEAPFFITAPHRNQLEPPHVGCYTLIKLSALFVLAVLSGCSKGGPSKNISSSVFDSAPADVKQSWNDGIAAWKNHRFAAAAT